MGFFFSRQTKKGCRGLRTKRILAFSCFTDVRPRSAVRKISTRFKKEGKLTNRFAEIRELCLSAVQTSPFDEARRESVSRRVHFLSAVAFHGKLSFESSSASPFISSSLADNVYRYESWWIIEMSLWKIFLWPALQVLFHFSSPLLASRSAASAWTIFAHLRAISSSRAKISMLITFLFFIT